MKGYEDLTEIQQQALSDAFGSPDRYDQPSLVRLDDPETAAEYEVFRDQLEGTQISKGSMEEEKIDSYKNIGFLREGDEGLEINSVWDTWQIERLEENEMYDFSQVDMYVTESADKPEVAVVGSEDDAFLSIEDSLTYKIPEANSITSAEYHSSNKIEEIAREFIEVFTGEGSEDSFFNNTRSKPEESKKGGENSMGEDYESIEDINEAVLNGEIQDVEKTAELIEQYRSDDLTMSEAYLISSTMEYQALQAGQDVDAVEVYNNALDKVEDAGAAAGAAVSRTARNAWDQIRAMEETEQGLRDAYVRHMLDDAEAFQKIADRDQELAEDISEENGRLETVADKLEKVSPETFDSQTHEDVTSELDELRRVAGLEDED